LSAFTLDSTTSSQRSGVAHREQYLKEAAAKEQHSQLAHGSSAPAPAVPSADPGPPLITGSSLVTSSSASGVNMSVPFNPFYDTIRQNLELSQGITERIPLRISTTAKDRVEELPFPWLREIGRWAGVSGQDSDDDDQSDASASETAESRSRSVSASRNVSAAASHCGSSSHSDGNTVSESADDRAGDRDHDEARLHVPQGGDPATQPEDVAEGSEALAMQFFRIELSEQRRLMGVMQHHSRESGPVANDDPVGEGEHTLIGKKKDKRKGGKGGDHARSEFPYSITAGVEKGAKNL